VGKASIILEGVCEETPSYNITSGETATNIRHWRVQVVYAMGQEHIAIVATFQAWLPTEIHPYDELNLVALQKRYK